MRPAHGALVAEGEQSMTSAAHWRRREPPRSARRRPSAPWSWSLCLAGCATTQGPASSQDVADPIEPVNRAVFSFNMFVDQWLLEPVARAYRFVTPEPARRSVANFLANLRSPVIFANDALQGERERAGDHARPVHDQHHPGRRRAVRCRHPLGYPRHDEDFGQTLGVWGVPTGPYLMLPLLGPSNGRDTVGPGRRLLHQPAEPCCITTDERFGLFGTGGGQRARGQHRAARRPARQQHRPLRHDPHDLHAKARRRHPQRRGRRPTRRTTTTSSRTRTRRKP